MSKLLAEGRFGYPTPPANYKHHQQDQLDSNTHCSDGKPKRKRPKFIRKVTCQVCGDTANDHIHYGATVCYSCRAFFRRGVSNNAPFYCSQKEQCTITKSTRKHCQYCRFQKCVSVGMKADWVMTEEDKKEKKEISIQRKILSPFVDKELLRKKKTYYEERMCKERLQKRASKLKKPMMPPLMYNNVDLKRPASPTSSFDDNSSSYTPLPSPPPLTPMSRSRRSSSVSSVSSIMSSEDTCTLASMATASTAAVLFDYSQPSVSGSSPASSQKFHGQNLGEDESAAEEVERFDPIGHCSTAQQLLSEIEANAEMISSSRSSVSQQFGQLMLRQPNMPLTHEEKGFAQQLLQIELATSRSIPVPPETMGKIIEAARTGTVIPLDAAIQGYTICMERVIKFATNIDLFQRFSGNDQFNLLLKNVDMVVNIRTARILRPEVNLRDQLSHAMGWKNRPWEQVKLGYGGNDKNSSGISGEKRLEAFQIFSSPWAVDVEYERNYGNLMRSIFNLNMDYITTTLLTMMALFSDGVASDLDAPEEIRAIQDGFSRLLYRYLCEMVGRPNAVELLPQYMQVLKNLQVMADILASKKLARC